MARDSEASEAFNDRPGTLGGDAAADTPLPTIEDALGKFPNSREAVALVARALKIASERGPNDGSDDEGSEDTRHERIRAAVAECSSDVRTRAAVVCSALARIAGEMRGLVAQVKADMNDADIVSGDAVVLPEGWLVVTMAGKEIGRVPYHPDRPIDDAGKLSSDMLSEYIKIQVLGEAEVARAFGDTIKGPPAPDGVRSIELFRPGTAGDLPH